jgi:CDP-diacylglycerol--glycerol-3-phosphate 3-phosphatidyltransferase
MSALREWAATLGPTARDAVAVNAWGKWKTASQMVALTALLLTRDGVPAAAAGGAAQLLQLAAAAGPPLLVVAAYLSAHSLALYLRGLWKYMA